MAADAAWDAAKLAHNLERTISFSSLAPVILHLLPTCSSPVAHQQTGRTSTSNPTAQDHQLQAYSTLYQAASSAAFNQPPNTSPPLQAILPFNTAHRTAGLTDCCICIRPASTPSDTTRRSRCKHFAIRESLVVTTQGPTASPSLSCSVPPAVPPGVSSIILDLRMSLSISTGGPSSLFVALNTTHLI